MLVVKTPDFRPEEGHIFLRRAGAIRAGPDSLEKLPNRRWHESKVRDKSRQSAAPSWPMATRVLDAHVQRANSGHRACLNCHCVFLLTATASADVSQCEPVEACRPVTGLERHNKKGAPCLESPS